MIKSQAEMSEAKIAIIHLGTNNVCSDTADEITTKLVSVGDYITEFTNVKTLAFSSIIHRRGESPEDFTRVNEVNQALKLVTNQRGWALLANDNIVPDTHLTGDGVHLNLYGTKMFASNIINYLRSFYPKPMEGGNVNSRPTSNVESFRPSHHQKFRRKPSGRQFPRDWIDSLETARRLLNNQQ